MMEEIGEKNRPNQHPISFWYEEVEMEEEEVKSVA